MRRPIKRDRIPFRSVNRPDQPGYDPGLQRHHLLPRQLLSLRCFDGLFETIRPRRLGFDDFRSNGLLLPCSEDSALRLGLPLHRGPHRQYNALVIARIGDIERGWSALRFKSPDAAREQSLMRLSLLQRALRRRLLDPIGRRLFLNRRDPLDESLDFSELDAMADALWGATDCIQEEKVAILAERSRRAS